MIESVNRSFGHHEDIIREWYSLNYDKAFDIAFDLFKKNPDDVSALYTIASYFCVNGSLEFAKELFVYLIDKVDFANIQRLEYVLCSLIRIELNLKNFESSYEYLQYAKQFFPYIIPEIQNLEAFLEEKMLGCNGKNYAYEKQLQHVIDKHGHFASEDSNCSEHTVFSDNISIEKLFFNVSYELKNIPRKNGFNPFEIIYNFRHNDIYFFKLPNCGYSLCSSNDICDYIKVIVVPFSKNIVSMYPISSLPIFADEIELTNVDDVKLNKIKSLK